MSISEIFQGAGQFNDGVQALFAGEVKATEEDLCRCAERGLTEACSLIVDVGGVGVDAKNADGWPAAVLAAKNGHVATAVALFERGAGADLAGPDGTTALHHAAAQDHTDLVKALVLFGAKDVSDKDGTPASKKAPANSKQLIREIAKVAPAGDKRKALAERFKLEGNKAFEKKENVKAVKFYTVAISHGAENFKFFSNRSAANFNGMKFEQALADGARCVAMDASWPRGYFRKGSSLAQLGLKEEALKVCKKAVFCVKYFKRSVT